MRMHIGDPHSAIGRAGRLNMNKSGTQPVRNGSPTFRFSVALALVLAVVMCWPHSAAAQGIVTGSISGVVQDKAGAVIPGATVTATQIGTNRKFTTASSKAGVVALPSLPVGTYTVTIEAPNFQKFEAKAVNVSVGKDTALGAVTMQVGSNTEVVTVEGAAPLVETTTNEISQTFDTKQTANLPIGNSYDSLALFVPGVATAGDASFSNNNGAEFSANGQRARSNNFQLDGQNNNDSTIGGPTIFFGNQDVISEVQVITNYSAEYGRNLGSTVNYITKSGTNNFHGTAYEFNQNSGLDSLDNQEKSRITDKQGNFFFTGPNGNPFCAAGQVSTDTDPCDKPRPPKYVDNRFGGTIGGPIVKDRVWFFGSTNMQRIRLGGGSASSGSSLTPTPAGIQQLQAAFPNSPGVAALAAFGPNAVKIGNPQFGNIQTIPVTANGVTVPIEFGSISRALSSPINNYEATGRVDFQLTQKDRLFVRYLFQQQVFKNQTAFFGSVAAAGGDFTDVPSRSQQVGLDLTHTFSPSVLNQVRFSYSRSRVAFEGGGFPNCLQTNLAGCTPQVVIDSPNDLGFGENVVFPQGRIINVWQLQDNASWLHNKHLIKFGGEYNRQRAPNYGLFNVNGVFEFPDFNSLVANTPILTTVADGPFVQRLKENDLAFYIQDDWRVKDNLTLNLGLRWEYFGQAANLLHDETVARQTGPNPLWDPTLPLDRTTVPKIPNHYRNFGPVFGFNYTPGFGKMLFGNGATVIRGGFRMAYDFPYYNMANNVAAGAPVVNLVSFASGTIPGIPAGTDFSAPAVQSALLQFAPTGGDPGLASQTLLNPDFRPPYSEQWNFGIQRQIGSKAAAEVRYVGNHTLHNFQEINGNPALGPLIDAGFANLIPTNLHPCDDPTQPGFDGGFRHADCARTNVVEYASTAYSIYHGLQTQLRMGNWHGLTMSASYTFSKTIDNTSEAFSSTGYGGNAVAYAQNPFDLVNAERGISGISYPHVFGLYLQYDLPWFKGQQGILGHLLGGWEVNTTYRYTSGQPYTVTQRWRPGSLCDPENFTGGSTRDACRPILNNASAPFDAVGQCTDPTAADCGLTDLTGTPIAMSSAHWILNNPNAAQFFGSPFLGIARNTARGQAISTNNLAFFKNVKLSERLTFQFQAQAFNVLNHQFLGVPNGRVNNAVTGIFGNPQFNNNGGFTFAGNTVTDGIDRRRFLFGGKFIF